MPTLDERIRQEIGDLVVKVHALNSEIERLNELLDREKLRNSGLSAIPQPNFDVPMKETLNVPAKETRQKANAKAQASDSAQA